jgi:hypothetical protein
LLTVIVAWIGLLVGGIATREVVIGTICFWLALVGWPFLRWRHPLFILVWGFFVVVGYFVGSVGNSARNSFFSASKTGFSGCPCPIARAMRRMVAIIDYSGMCDDDSI